MDFWGLFRIEFSSFSFTEKWCHSYDWVYPLPRGKEALWKSLTSDFDFRPNIIVNSIRNVLRYSLMQSLHSLLVLKPELHYPTKINFTLIFQKLTGDVIVKLRDREKGLGSNARVYGRQRRRYVRKLNKKPLSLRNDTAWRFLTEPVRNWYVLH
jgi:hypothetical protein